MAMDDIDYSLHGDDMQTPLQSPRIKGKARRFYPPGLDTESFDSLL